MKLINLATRTIEDDDLDFIHELLQIHYQEALFQGWTTIKSIDGVLLDRLVVVTNFRLILIKVEETSRTITLNVPLLDLSRVTMAPDDPYSLFLDFREDHVMVFSTKTLHILEAVLFALMAVTEGVPRNLLPKIDVPTQWLEDFHPPNMNHKNGIVASYLGVCDYLEITCRPQIIDYFIQTLQAKERCFDLRSCLWYIEKPTPFDIDAITTALRFSSYFRSFGVHGVGLSEDSLQMVGKVLESNKSISDFSLSNLRVPKNGINSLSQRLRNGHSLKRLSISKFQIGDEGVSALVTALSAANLPLESLELREVGMSEKGMKDISSLFKNPLWGSQLLELDVSENRIGKGSGSALVSKILAASAGLQRFHVESCELDLEAVLGSIARNHQLNRGPLKDIDVSGNKMSSKGMEQLCLMLSGGSQLQRLALRKCSLKKSLYEQLLKEIMNQEDRIKISLDLGGNDLKSSAAKKMANVFPTAKSEAFSEILLSGNDMGADGVITFCKSIHSFSNLSKVALDANVSAGIFTKVVDVGTALASLVDNLPSLKQLSLVGDSNYFLKEGLVPLFRYLSGNSTLVQLNVSGNRFSEECFTSFFGMIKTNRKLRIVEADHNKWTPELVKQLRDVMLKNLTLVDTALIPLSDLGALYSQQPKDRTMLQELIDDIEAKLFENSQSSTYLDNNPTRKRTASTSYIQKQGNRTVSSVLDDKFVADLDMDRTKPVSDSEVETDIAAAYSYDRKKKVIKQRRSMSREVKDFFTLEEMRSPGFQLPRGYDVSRKEVYLTDDDFFKLFHVTKPEFEKWADWKKSRKRKEARL